jgi:hypothetical protein
MAMKKSPAVISVLIASLFFFVPPIQAIDYSKSSPTRKTISTNTIFPPAKYAEWKSAKSQVLKTIPYFSYDSKWKANLPKLRTNLDKIDNILTQVKNSSDAYIKANKSYFKNLASELPALVIYLESMQKTLDDIGSSLGFEMQTAMTQYTQASKAMSNLCKKTNDAAKRIISSI